MLGKITSRTLAWMRTQPKAAPAFGLPVGSRVGAMLKLEQLGLVRRSTHKRLWALTDAGRKWQS